MPDGDLAACFEVLEQPLHLQRQSGPGKECHNGGELQEDASGPANGPHGQLSFSTIKERHDHVLRTNKVPGGKGTHC